MDTDSALPPRIGSDDSSRTNSNRRMWIVLACVLGGLCLFCCGGPTLIYFAVPKYLTARREAPATPEPLSPNELLDWFRSNGPTQPFVWHEVTRDNVDLRATVLEVNTGSDLRTAGTTDKFRTKLKDMEPEWRERFASWGDAQLIFRGEQDNQEVICWFADADSIRNITAGQDVVVRGRKASIEVSIRGGREGKRIIDSFQMDLVRCRVVSE